MNSNNNIECEEDEVDDNDEQGEETRT